jgi:putative DNA primase/helicase
MIIDIAKAVPIESEIARRGITLVRRHYEHVGPCPVCGGRDRFAINTTKRVWNCRGCNRGGDVIDLVQFLDGVDHRTACQTLAGQDVKSLARADAGGRKVHPVERAKTDSDDNNTQRALRLWDDASPIIGTPLAQTYFRRRKLEPPDDDEALRSYSGCPFGDTRYPCVLALFRDIHTNEPKAIHRIALGPGGILIGKKMLGPVGGAAVKLDADENVEYGLTIAEGVETALGGRMLGFKPAWALGSAGAIRNFPVLNGIDCLTILVDNDETDRNGRQAGQQAATECWRRWKDAGREVQAFSTDKPGTDIADVIKEANHG